MSLPIQDQANILHGIRGGWAMRSEIINALLIREAANQRTTIEKLIGYEEEGSLLPRGKETLDRIARSELQVNETPTQNKAIRVLAFTGHKWIVDPDPIKVQPDWHICTHETHGYVRSVGTLCNGHGVILMRVKEANLSLSFNSQLDWVVIL